LLLNSPHQSLLLTVGWWVFAEDPFAVVVMCTVGG
jgi:hypothetical protein